ncbi:MAG: hypothetical protein ACRD3R_06660 [Terriglobales bacterium]
MNDDLASRRVDRAKSNQDVRPVDLLRAMADDIESGRLQCDGLVLLYLHRPPTGQWGSGTYRAGVTYDQEFVAIELARERCLRKWLQP